MTLTTEAGGFDNLLLPSGYPHIVEADLFARYFLLRLDSAASSWGG